MADSSQPTNVYERLYDKPLDKEKVAELRHNLIGYIKVLIEMDKQHKEYIKHQKQKKELIVDDSK